MLTMIKVRAPENVYTTLMEQYLGVYFRLYSLFGKERLFNLTSYAYKLGNDLAIVDIVAIDYKLNYNNKTYVRVV